MANVKDTDKDSFVPRYIGHRGRMKDKLFKKGVGALTEEELLEMLLMRSIPRRDVKPIARELLRCFGSFAGVVRAKPEELCAVKYVKESTVALFALIQQVCETLLLPHKNTRIVIDSIEKLVDYLSVHLKASDEPLLHTAYLDRRCQILALEDVCVGDDLVSRVHPKEILKRALNLNAHFVILVSNRPSDNVDSFCLEADVFQQIERLTVAAGIKFFDHLVVSGDKIYSRRDKKFLPYRTK